MLLKQQDCQKSCNFLHGSLAICNGKIISKGNNNNRTCHLGNNNIPCKIKKNYDPSTHAEMDTIFKLLKRKPRNFNKLTIFVVRISINKNGSVNLLNSAPCANCAKKMKSFGVKKIVWSNSEGELVWCNLAEYETSHLSHAQKILIKI